MVDLQAKKGSLSFKDALLSKYSFDDEESDEELCFIHFTGSPKHKGTFKELVNLKFNLFLASGCTDIEHLFKLNERFVFVNKALKNCERGIVFGLK